VRDMNFKYFLLTQLLSPCGPMWVYNIILVISGDYYGCDWFRISKEEISYGAILSPIRCFIIPSWPTIERLFDEAKSLAGDVGSVGI
jgi:hypothetical protein